MFLRKKNTINKVLACTLVLAVVFSFAVQAVLPVGNSAGDFDCAYICDQLGILRGEGNGVTDEYLAKQATRVQAAYLTLRLVGKETEAVNYRGTDNFNDVGHIYADGQRMTAYLKAHSYQYGWQGDGTNRLMPDDRLTAQQFYKVLLTVLGYEVFVDYDYDDTLDFAEDVANMFECRYITEPLTNDDIAVMLVEAMMAKMKGETYTLAEFLAEEGVIDYNKAVSLGVIKKVIELQPTPTPPVVPPVAVLPGTLQYTEIITSNFAEIDIVFNQIIDKTSVDRNYIKFDNKALEDTDVVRVLDDGLTLRIYRPLGFVSVQGAVRKLSVSKVKTPAGLEMSAISEYEVRFMDQEAPSLVDVEAFGLKRVKLTFSEPLRVSDSQVKNYTIYRFNGRAISTTDQIVCTGREVYLSLSQNLERGQNSLKIDTNRLYDLANFPIFDVENYIFYAEEDTTQPVVLGVEAYREKIIVTFNNEVRDSARFYWLDGTLRRYSNSQEKDLYDRNIITFYYNEGSYLPIANTEIVIDSIVGMNGVSGADYRQFVMPMLDTVRPEVVEIISENLNEIVVMFSKPVRLGSTNNGRFTLRNENNVNITLTTQAYTPAGATSPDNRYIKLTGNIPVGTYTLTVTNVEDMTAQANRCIETVQTVRTLDNVPPSVVSVSTNLSESKVVITFNKTLDWGSASDIANYQYKAPGRGHVEMPSGTQVLLESDTKTVVITFPSNGWVVSGNTVTPNAFALYIASNSGEQIRLMDIKDTSGNKMEPTTINVPSSNEVAAKLTGYAYATTTNKIVLPFGSGALPMNAYSGDFIVRASSGGNIPIRNMSSADIDATRRELSIYMMDGYELNSDGTYGSNHLAVSVSLVLPSQIQYTKTALGSPLEMETPSAIVEDNIRPGYYEAFRGNRAAQNSGVPGVKYPALAVNQVLVVFDKDVRFFSVTNSSQLGNLIVVTTESAPNAPMSPTAYTVEAFDGNLMTSAYNSSVNDVRMIIVTIKGTTPPDAISVTVNANLLWNGKLFSDGQYVMNSLFSTEYLPMIP